MKIAQYSAQLRNVIIKKMLPLEERPITELAKEYGISVTALYGWHAKLKSGTLVAEDRNVTAYPLDSKP